MVKKDGKDCGVLRLGLLRELLKKNKGDRGGQP